MRYFAMIDGERRGPFELSELAEAGVGPDTYVWCKGMDDWQKAEDVADICRFFRLRIFDLMHPSPQNGSGESEAEATPAADNPLTGFRFGDLPPVESQTDNSVPPFPTLTLSILMTFFCFPITGLVAVYYSYKARATWQEAIGSESGPRQKLYDEAERARLRARAHDYARQAKMWIGITFFLSLIFYAFVSHKLI